jgi:hypothetical protein
MRKDNFLVLCLLLVFALSVPGWAGTLTDNEFIYKPSAGARGDREKNAFDSGLDRVDARLAKENWVGDPRFGSTIQSATTALGANPSILRVPAGVWNITDNLTIPSNISLKVERGAILAVADGKTLTINGPLEAGLYRVFSWSGTGHVAFGTWAVREVYPEWFGAVADGVTDCTSALQVALWVSNSVRLSLGTYKITDECHLYLNNQSLIGMGPGTIISNTTAKNSLVVDAGLDRILISNLSIIGNASASGSDQTAAIHTPTPIENPITNLTINKVWIKNVNGCGIAIGAVNNGIISDCYIEGSYSHNVYISVCKNILISNLYSKNGAAQDVAGGQDLKIKNSSGVVVSNSRLTGGSNSNIAIEGDGLGTVQDIHLSNLTCDVSKAGAISLQIGSAAAPVGKITVTGGSYTTAADCNAPIVLNGAVGSIPANVQFNGVTAISPNYNAVYAVYGDNIRFNGGYYEGVAGGYAIQTTSTTGTWYYNGVTLCGGYGINHEGTAMYVTGCIHTAAGASAGYSFVPGASTTAIIADCFNANGALHQQAKATDSPAGGDLYARHSGRTYSNAGASGTISWHLPPATPGLQFTFVRIASQTVRLDPNGSEVIRGGGAGKYLELDHDGDNVTLKCLTNGTWEIIGGYGSYMFES